MQEIPWIPSLMWFCVFALVATTRLLSIRAGHEQKQEKATLNVINTSGAVDAWNSAVYRCSAFLLFGVVSIALKSLHGKGSTPQ
jgi:hypothetical protein